MDAALQHTAVTTGELIAGKYRLGGEIGRGANGTVYEAVHEKLQQRVAIKVLRDDKHSDARRARMLREARLAATLRSDHTVRIIDIVEVSQGIPCIVMEYLEGTCLSRLLAAGPLAPALAVEVLIQVCEALSEAHASGLVHRDLKPANLFLTTTPSGKLRLKVLDFGLAKSVIDQGDAESISQSQVVVGSPAYMSPEQIRASKHVDARTDVWALGVVLQQLLTGRLPFSGANSAAMLAAIAADPPRLLAQDMPSAPFALQKVIDRCLRKRALQRYARVEELARDLQALQPALAGVTPLRVASNSSADQTIDTEQSMTMMPDLESRASKVRERKRWAWAVGSALLLAVVVYVLVLGRRGLEILPTIATGSATSVGISGNGDPTLFATPATLQSDVVETAGAPAMTSAAPEWGGPSPRQAAEDVAAKLPSDSEPTGSKETELGLTKAVKRTSGSKAPAPSPPSTPKRQAPGQQKKTPDPLDRQW